MGAEIHDKPHLQKCSSNNPFEVVLTVNRLLWFTAKSICSMKNA